MTAVNEKERHINEVAARLAAIGDSFAKQSGLTESGKSNSVWYSYINQGVTVIKC